MPLIILLILATVLSGVDPLPLGMAAATPLRDEIAGDGQGGWTDQGDNDLRSLPAGSLQAAGITFTVGGNAIVLADGRIANRPRSVSVAAGGRQGACIYLLHASAWTPRDEVVIGRIRVHFADGASEEREVRSRRELADWWNPAERLPAAALGWSGDNPHALVGLYVAQVRLSDKPIERLELEVANGAVWMVVGLALGGEQALRGVQPDILAAGPRWLPAPVPWEVAAGSALDLGGSGAAVPPARLVARGGDLVLEGGDGRPVRLLGANLCFSANFPDKPVAERMATAFRRMGYNAVRFHHHDGRLVRPGGDGTELDPDKLDRLDFLAACCEREGLWLTTDVLVSRRLPKGALPELPDMEIGGEFKALIPLLPSALENWKRFATAFLGHRNPYTGRTWAEDPALATLSLVNEDNLPGAMKGNARVKALYDERFAAWLAGRPADEQAGAAREQARGRWLLSLQAAAYVAMREHVRGLGVRAPTTGANWQTDWWSLALRDGFDLVDNHIYHDHPGFPGKPFQLPMTYNQRSPVAELLRVPATLAHTRRLDRPFTVSEIQYCQPNHRRAEYAAGVAAVAGLQGWSGLWRFAFAHNIALVDTADGGIAGFDIARDPIALLGERALALLWRRGDVVAAPWSVGLLYDPAVAGGGIGVQPPAALAALALHTGVGCLPASARTASIPGLRYLVQDPAGSAAVGSALPTLIGDAGLPAAIAASGLATIADVDLKQQRIRSVTGQVRCDARAGILSVITPTSVAAVLPAGGAVDLGGLGAANPDSEPATVVVAALDGLPLARSKRLLVLHLTDAQSSGVRFASPRHNLVEAWGGTPILVRAGSVRLDLPGAGRLTAWALDFSGARREQLALNGGRLDAVVERAWGPCLAWEVVRE